MAQYVVGLDSSLKRIFVWKTTGDPTTLTNWSAQDRGLYLGHQISGIWAVLNGTDIEVAIAYQGSANTNNRALIKYAQFDTTTDEWAVGHEFVFASNSIPDSSVVGLQGVSIIARTSDLILLYSEYATGTVVEIDYARGTSGSWTVNNNVSATGTELAAGVAVEGASDRAHFFYFDNDNDDILHRSLSSANVLDTEASVDAAVGASVLHPIGRGISYPDNGNTTVKVPYLDADESITSARIDVSGANPTIATDTAASDNDAEDINSSLVACFAIDGTDTQMLYSGGGASGVDQDIFYDTEADGGSWGTDTEEQDAVTANRLSAGVYERSGTRLGYVWLDGTTTSYDEIALLVPFIAEKPLIVGQAINRASTY